MILDGENADRFGGVFVACVVDAVMPSVHNATFGRRLFSFVYRVVY